MSRSGRWLVLACWLVATGYLVVLNLELAAARGGLREVEEHLDEMRSGLRARGELPQAEGFR